MQFKGKVSWWFYAIIIGVAAILVPIIAFLIVEKILLVAIINFVVFVIVELFCFCIAFHNYVELKNEYLLIVFGFIKMKILYDDIVELSITNDFSSSLAASLDRIKIIQTDQSAVMIALLDKEIFFNEIKKRNPKITVI